MDETAAPAATATAGGLRDRVSARVLRRQVREQLTAELNKRAKKKGAAFRAAAVAGIVESVPDADIDAAADRARAESAHDEGVGAVGGPILDFLKANPELVKKVVEILLSLLLA